MKVRLTVQMVVVMALAAALQPTCRAADTDSSDVSVSTAAASAELEDLPLDQDIDLTSFITALFDDSEEDDVPGKGRESRQLDDEDAGAVESDGESPTTGTTDGEDKTENTEKRAVSDPATIAKYNNFMDVFFRRLNSELRKQGDPLKVGLSKSGKSKGNTKSRNKNDKKGKNKGNKKSKNSSSKKSVNKKNENIQSEKRKNKSRNRHPKDLSLGAIEELPSAKHNIAASVDVQAETDQSRIKRELSIELIEEEEEEEEIELKITDADDNIEDQGEGESIVKGSNRESKDRKFTVGLGMAARRAQQMRGVRGNTLPKRANRPGRKSNNKNKSNAKNKNKRGANKKKKGPHSNAKKGVKKNKNKGKKKPSTRALVSGFSSLARRGAVRVTQSANTQRIVSDFTIGPVQVELSRQFSGSEVRTARTSASSISGTVVIEVTKSGRAKVAKLKLAPPANVRVVGNLTRGGDKKGGKQDKLLKASIKRVSPKISKRIKNAARSVLDSTSAVVRSY